MLKKFLFGLISGLVIAGSLVGGVVVDRRVKLDFIDKWLGVKQNNPDQVLQREVLSEESIVIDVVEKVGPSVVTIGIKKTQTTEPFSGFFDPFGFFTTPQKQTETKEVEEDIGSGFIISNDGLIVTNKHVVDDTSASYRVFTEKDKLYEVEKIYRDPTNDMAILKISAPAGELTPVELGDSKGLKVGQFVIAIGTALGEFRNTVTTGVISGLGRGITAGSPLEESESLDNVIQTDAAINLGNSGGPLLNSLGQVIGVNVAVAQGAQNIGFALPINLVKESIDNFNQTGQFTRPYLGVKYRMIEQKEAVAKGWVEGAGVVEIITDSPAEKAGIQQGDIITKINGQLLNADNSLIKVVGKLKVGDNVEIIVWRGGKEEKIKLILEEAK